MSESEQPDVAAESPPPNPVDKAISLIESASDEDLRGHERLGSLAFAEEDVGTLREIARILRSGRNENHEYWSSSYRSDFATHAEAVVSTVERMLALRADDEAAAETKTELQSEIQAHYTYACDTIRPRFVETRVREALESARPATEAELRRLETLKEAGDALQARVDQLETKLTGMEPVVEAQRAAAAEDATEELSREYRRQAKDHYDAWKLWLKVLIGSGAVAVAAGVLLLVLNRPSGDINAGAVARLVLDLYVIGLLLYAVRVASLQFRVHRHLEAKAKSKAAALSTFSRFVGSGAEPTTRDVVAQTLAQAVFESGDTGFVDAGSDQITLIERVVGPVVQRASQ